MGTLPHNWSLIDDRECAEIVLHPIRSQMLRMLRAPGSASSLSKVLGIPRQKLNYHLKELERVGLVKKIDSVRKRNCVEQIYVSIARQFAISPKTLEDAGLSADRVLDKRSLEYVAAIGAKLIDDIAHVSQNAGEGQAMPSLTLESAVSFATEADRYAFGQELSNAASQLAAKYGIAEGHSVPFRMVLVIHPQTASPSES